MNTEIEKYQVEQIIEVINQLDYNELITLNNEFCEAANYPDNEIFYNGEDFYNDFFGDKPIQLARAIFYGDFNFSHDYIIFNGYGNLETFADYNIINNLADSVKNIAKHVCDNSEKYTLDISYIYENQ
jgi:hypothetical protein